MVKKFLKSHPVHKKIVPHLDYLFLLRPTLFFSVWVMMVMGMATARIHSSLPAVGILQISYSTLLVFIGVSLVSAAAFILNQIMDVDSDSVNKKLFLVGKHISLGKSRKVAQILAATGIVLTLLGNWVTSIAAALLYFLWGILYNQPPFQWKKKPIAGWMVNIFSGILLYLIGWIIISTRSEFTSPGLVEFFTITLPYIFCFASVALLTTLPDVKGDESAGDNTFPLVFGKNITLLIAFILPVGAFILGLKNADPLASTASITAIPFFVFALFRRLDKDILRAIRYPIFILNFFALTVYPYLAIPLIITFYLSKYYYWHRFELHYPTFLVDDSH
ncbi:MAG: UbiA family prenyltransferase [Candidatus Marinimicrobia bacterium]|nr:UbiA family prenyltransferase [Candidatus Neomarinimicrobiota bacterium]